MDGTERRVDEAETAGAEVDTRRRFETIKGLREVQCRSRAFSLVGLVTFVQVEKVEEAPHGEAYPS